jgi:hypothetical protein
LLTVKRRTAEMMILLLQHGADPRCLICTTNHWEGHNKACDLTQLHQIMEDIAPTESLTALLELRELCSDRALAYALRRNQRRRAVKALLAFEQSNEALGADFALQGTHPVLGFLSTWTRKVGWPYYATCDRCLKERSTPARLTTQCLDCGGLSNLCLDCVQLDTPELNTLRSPCGGSRGDSATIHTSVILLWEPPSDIESITTRPLRQDYIDSLRSQHTNAKALEVVKEWYAKDPIEPDPSFEDVVRSTRTTSLPPIPQTQEPATITGEVSLEHGGRSDRPWLL